MKAPIHSRPIHWFKNLILPSTAAAIWIATQTPAAAANYYWDPVVGNNQIDAGSGSWDTDAGNITWSATSTGVSNSAWANGTGIIAVFGPTSAPAGSYAVAVSSGIQAQSITFNCTGYLLTAASPTTINLGYGGTGSITVGTGVTANIGDGITIVSGTGGSQPLTLTGTGTINVSSSSEAAPVTLKSGLNNNVNIQGGVNVVIGANGSLQAGVNAVTGTGSMVVGTSGTSNATLTVDGGAVNNFGNFVLGNAAAAGVSTVNLESGTISTLGTSGTFRLGPTVTTTSGTGILNLNGGTLRMGSIAVGAAGNASYYINFNGGVVKAAQSTSNFMAASSQITAKVLAGGAVFDTDGNNITIAQSLISGTANDGGLTKQGAGILTLNGTNTYNGATAVKEGSLALGAGGIISNTLILGSAGSSGTLDVSLKGPNYTQANISGNGGITSGGTVTADGTVAPGFGAGALTVAGNFTLAGTAMIQMEIAGNGGQIGVDFDNIDVSGILTYGGALTVSGYNGYDLAQSGSYTLFNFTSKSGDFSSVTVNNVALIKSGETWADASSTYSFDQSSGVLSVTAVPEPGTYVMLLGGLGLLGMLRRKLRA